MELLPQEHVSKPESPLIAHVLTFKSGFGSQVSRVSHESNNICGNHFAKPCINQSINQYSIFECTVCRVHTRAKLPHAALSNCN